MQSKIKALKAMELVYVARCVAMIESVGGNAATLKQLGKLARRLETIGVHACNGTKYMGENGDEEQQRACDNIYIQIKMICDKYNLFWYHQTDPRGSQLYISGKEALTQMNYNTAGFAVDQF